VFLLESVNLLIVRGISLSDGIMVKLCQCIGAELMSLGHFIEAHEVLLLLAGHEDASFLEFEAETLVILGETSLHILVHEIILAETCSILN